MSNSTTGIRAGAAYVELFVKDNRLVRGLDAAARRVKALGGSIRSIGVGLAGLSAAALAPLTATIFKFAAAGDKLDKMSIRTGISAENLSQLGFAAEQSGSNIDTLGRALKDMKKNIGEGKLGDFFGGKSEFEQLMMLADVVSSIEDPAERAAAAMKIFAESGNELAPMLAVGSKGIKSLMSEADQLGLTISTDGASKAAAFSDAWNRIKRSMEAATIAIGSALAPEVTKLLSKLTPVGKRIIDWINQNKQLTLAIAGTAVGIGAAGIAFIAFGTALKVVGLGLGTVTVAFTLLSTMVKLVVIPFALLSTAIGVVTKVLTALSIAINLSAIATTALTTLMTASVTVWGILTAAVSGFGAVLGFILSPLGLVTAALALLGISFISLFTDFDEWGRGATKIGNEISAGFKGVAKDFGEMFKGVKMAIQSKQWENAWKLVILYLKKVWAEFLDWVDKQANDQLRVAMNKGSKFGHKIGSGVLANLGSLFTDMSTEDLKKQFDQDLDTEIANRNAKYVHTPDPKINELTKEIADLQEVIRLENERHKKEQAEQNPGNQQDGVEQKIMNMPKAEIAQGLNRARDMVTASGSFQSQMAAQALGFDSQISPEAKKIDELKDEVMNIKKIIEQQLGFK